MEKKKQEISDDFLGINPAMDHMMSVIRHQSKMTDIIEDKKEKSYPQEPKLIELGSDEEWQYPTTLDEVVKVKRKMSLDLTKAQIALENGDLDPSKTKIIINQTIKMLTDWTKNHVDPKAHDQLVGVGVITHGEHKITSSQGGKYFDFSECEDVTKMAEHKKIMEEGLINDFKKIAAGDREKEYEILKDGFYRNTGSDVIKKLPKLKYRKDSLRITKI